METKTFYYIKSKLQIVEIWKIQPFADVLDDKSIQPLSSLYQLPNNNRDTCVVVVQLNAKRLYFSTERFGFKVPHVYF